MGRAKKDPFEDLPEEWRDGVAAMSQEQIRLAMAQVTMNEQDNQTAQDDDQDLENLKDSVKVASEGYREATKANKLRLKYLRRVLEDKGGA